MNGSLLKTLGITFLCLVGFLILVYIIIVVGVNSNANQQETTEQSQETTQSTEPEAIYVDQEPEYPEPDYGDTSDQVTQSYWYCWDTGDPSPHHLGYRVDGDHLCTDGELQAAGF